jgi:hypothetical protein
MEKKGFYMLGVVHRDSEGTELLRQWLRLLEPEVITLEFSRYGLAFREEQGDRFRARIAEALKDSSPVLPSCKATIRDMLLTYVDLPYEYKVTMEASKQHAIPLYLVDMDFFSYLKLRNIGDLLSPENLKQCKPCEPSEEVRKEKTLARLSLKEALPISPYSDEMYIRDKYMSDRIGVLMKYHKGRRFVHVCGWRHLPDPSRLYAPFNPTKVFAYDTAPGL